AKIAMRKAGVVTYLLGDHLGSTSVVFDDSTNGIQRQGYRPFGEKRYPTGPSPLPTDYQYTGQRGFEEIGLQYYGARWYDGFLGRFTQADTLIPEPGNPMAWDRYAYALNAPTIYTDPTGHAYCPSNTPGAMCVDDEPDPPNVVEQASVASSPAVGSSVSNSTVVLSNGTPETPPSFDPDGRPTAPPTGTGLPEDGWEWNDDWPGLGPGYKNKHDPNGRVYRPDQGRPSAGEQDHWHVREPGKRDVKFPKNYQWGRKGQRSNPGQFDPDSQSYLINPVTVFAVGITTFMLLMPSGGGSFFLPKLQFR
ncbi:MAG: RHS repeat-associated core domain-containing protein, partial [Dehalobacter sp.]|nr:RHS repeat-associated core domain-containing protein [Dehalobacter sp.]